MNKTMKWTIGAALAGSLAVAAIAPAEAGVHVGIGIGVPVAAPAPAWCYRHPGACRPAYAPAVGVFVPGHGYWDGHGWYRHRERWHGGWRYR
jgi:hypothetical protein